MARDNFFIIKKFPNLQPLEYLKVHNKTGSDNRMQTYAPLQPAPYDSHRLDKVWQLHQSWRTLNVSK